VSVGGQAIKIAIGGNGIMTTEMMTAEQWAGIYARENGTGAGRFWIAMLAALVIGTVLGVLVVPQEIIPGVREAEAARNQRITELETQVSTLEASATHHDVLTDAIEENVAQTNAEFGTEMVIRRTASAIVYTVHSPESGSCVDFVVAQIEDSVRTASLVQSYSC
jgi:uncharacterized protein HemX